MLRFLLKSFISHIGFSRKVNPNNLHDYMLIDKRSS